MQRNKTYNIIFIIHLKMKFICKHINYRQLKGLVKYWFSWSLRGI